MNAALVLGLAREMLTSRGIVSRDVEVRIYVAHYAHYYCSALLPARWYYRVSHKYSVRADDEEITSLTSEAGRARVIAVQLLCGRRPIETYRTWRGFARAIGLPVDRNTDTNTDTT